MPNLVISPNSQSPVTYAYIRGIGSDQLVAGFDPGVCVPPRRHLRRSAVVDAGRLVGHAARRSVARPAGHVVRPQHDGRFDQRDHGRIRRRSSKRSSTSPPATTTTCANAASSTVRSPTTYRGGSQSSTKATTAIRTTRYGHNGDVTDYTSVRGKLKFDLSENANLVLTAQNFREQRQSEPAPSRTVCAGRLRPGAADRNRYGRHLRRCDPEPEERARGREGLSRVVWTSTTTFSARLTWDFDWAISRPGNARVEHGIHRQQLVPVGRHRPVEQPRAVPALDDEHGSVDAGTPARIGRQGAVGVDRRRCSISTRTCRATTRSRTARRSSAFSSTTAAN